MEETQVVVKGRFRVSGFQTKDHNKPEETIKGEIKNLATEQLLIEGKELTGYGFNQFSLAVPFLTRISVGNISEGTMEEQWIFEITCSFLETKPEKSTLIMACIRKVVEDAVKSFSNVLSQTFETKYTAVQTAVDGRKTDQLPDDLTDPM